MISYPNKLYHLCLLLIFFNTNIYASDIIVFSDSLRARYIGKEVSFLEDLSDSLKIEYIANYGQFQHSDHDNLYFGMSSSAFWIKFSIQNRLEKDIFLKLENPLIDFADLYTPNPDGKFEIQRTGEAYPFHSRQYKSEFFLFKLKKDSKIQTYYLRVKSSEPVIIPISIGSPIAINALSANNDLFIGIYIGIAGVLVLYNFFIFLFIRDKAYLFYVLGVFSLVFTQLVLLGFAYRLLWPSWTWFNNFSVVLFPSLAGIFILKFTQRFLNTKEFVTFNTITKGIIGLYLFAIISKGFDFHQIAFRIVDINALLMSILILHIAFLRIKNNYRPAKFFLLGWTLPLVGFLIFCLRNFGILPFNAFTNFILPISTAMEGIIFSLALADKINILKKENEQSQNEIIKYLKENEKHIIAAKESELIVEKLKKETLVSQFESLKNQVNPHFLFNSLNVLTELIFQNQDKAAKFVEELSEVYRYVLDSKNKEVIELKSELEFIEAFIYLLRIRFSDNISLHVNIINKDNSIMIPPLALQLLIENAVKHNVISQKHHLTIDIYEDDQNIVVRNNLVAKSGLQTQSGIGLNNIKSRYSFFSDRIIEIEKSDKYFTVKLPKLKFTNQNPGHASISH